MLRKSTAILWLIALFAVAQCLEEEETHRFCNDLSCAPRERLLEVIREMQEDKMQSPYRGAHPNAFIEFEHTSKNKNPLKVSQLDDAAVNTTCSICNMDPPPCLNGGTCQADPNHPFTKYRNTTCGINTDCSVRNHQIICQCKPGYLGNPRLGCKAQTIRTCADGDPHFKSFDGLYYDYQGTCPFIYSEPCTSLEAPFNYYSVKAKSELAGTGAHVSYIREVEVEFYTLRIHVDGNKRTVYVNGIKTCVPYYWPSKSNPRISVKYNSGTFFIQNDQNVLVTYDWTGRLCLQVPNIPQFQGNDTLCGIAGNINKNKADDVKFKNGTVLPLANPNARQPTKDNGIIFNKAEDTWITDDFLKLRNASCINGEQLFNNSDCVNIDRVFSTNSVYFRTLLKR
ncbi:hypothetical protein WR25_27111 isoform B [Diploscapter pachys]|uniref:VWFD domain-containing protein n=1 Tax=Diploscapter pachys TaxID=2018661 RepID=A0A2A2KJI4_9BILA|nr:hypothetical protein WR25_27111 isoform B [Diploscapter pachys]